MLHQLFFGLLLGWGAAIPIGPMNLEIIRRNLRYGTRYGIALGIGASGADVTYLILLSLGALAILNHPTVLQVIGILGSLILGWFGYSALRMNINKPNPDIEHTQQITYPSWRHCLEGYLLTLVNPFTILFWSSVSTQIAVTAHTNKYSSLFAGIGVLLGTLSWICGLNLSLHLTRHRLPRQIMQIFNYIGGIILLGFAIGGIWHALHLDVRTNL